MELSNQIVHFEIMNSNEHEVFTIELIFKLQELDVHI